MTKAVFILDFDRCLGNKNVYTLFDEVVAETKGIDIEKLKKIRREVESKGESFDTLSWLKYEPMHDEGIIKRLSNEYIRRADERGNDRFLSRGAKELLTYLESAETPYMIMTYGGKDYQILKLRAAGLQNVPTEIVARKEKAVYIARWWYEAQRKFVVPLPNRTPVSVDTVVLVDDKAISFHNLPERASGYWVRDDDNITASQTGVVPKSVKALGSLNEVLEDIKRQ